MLANFTTTTSSPRTDHSIRATLLVGCAPKCPHVFRTRRHTFRQTSRIPASSCPVTPQRPSAPQLGTDLICRRPEGTKRILVSLVAQKGWFVALPCRFQAVNRPVRETAPPLDTGPKTRVFCSFNKVLLNLRHLRAPAREGPPDHWSTLRQQCSSPAGCRPSEGATQGFNFVQREEPIRGRAGDWSGYEWAALRNRVRG